MDEKTFDDMNVIPLVDIMLVLLTIVLTTSTFVATGVLPVNLPRAAATSREALKSHVIEIDSQGALHWDGTPTDMKGLHASLTPLGRDTPILIRADKALPLQRFVDILDRISGLGFSGVRLQTQDR